MNGILQLAASADESVPASTNPAISCCRKAWQITYDEKIAKNKSTPVAEFYAAQSYRSAMPPLSGYENIQDFIACTAYGLLIGAIQEANSSKLLYAAQVALSSIRSQPSLRHPSTENAPPPPSPLPPQLPQDSQ
jgi:hypothetical protein